MDIKKLTLVAGVKPAIAIRITPELAKEWVGDMFTHQRNLKISKCRQFAKDITDSKWILNGESIIISNETPPRVLDGNHRLRACILANIPFESYVVSDMSPEVFHSIDQGTSRTAVDVLDIDSKTAGRAAIRNVTKVAAAAGLCYDYERGSFRKTRPLPRDIMNYIHENPMIEQWVADAMSGGTKSTRNHSAFMAAITYLVSSKYPLEAKEFLHMFVTGEDLRHGNPVLALRRYLLDEEGGKVKKMKSAFSRKNIFSVMARAWNAFVDKETVSHFRIQKEFIVLKGGPLIDEIDPDDQ